MFSRENIKYSILIAFISVLFYKFIDNPKTFIAGIDGFLAFLSPFLIGIFISLLISPIMMGVERKFKTPRIINIAIVYMFLIIILFIGFRIIIPYILTSINNMIVELPLYMKEAQIWINNSLTKSKFFNNTAPLIQGNIDSILGKTGQVLSKVSSDILLYAVGITSNLFNLIIGITISVYALKDKEKIGLGFKRLLYASTTRNRANNIIGIFKLSHNIFQSYLVGISVEAFIVGILAFLGLSLLHVKYALLLSIIIMITNVIPYFGPFIGAIPAITMTIIDDPIKAFWVAIFILVLQQLDGNIIGPKIMGDIVGLDPLWVISAILVGGAMFGFLGFFIAVPIAAVIRVILSKYVDSKLYIKNSK